MDLSISYIDLGFVDAKLIGNTIICFTFKEEYLELDLAKALKMKEVAKKLGGGKKLLTLHVLALGLTPTKEARNYGGTEEAFEFCSAQAIISTSLAHRILGNFYMRVNSPLVPTRLFKSEDLGIIWLRSIS